MRRIGWKWWLVLALVPIATLFAFNTQLRYLHFRYVNQSTATLPGLDIHFANQWLTAPDSEPGQVTASRFDAWGFSEPTHFVTVQKLEAPLSPEVLAQLPVKAFPWGEARIVATSEARQLVGVDDAAYLALFPDLEVLVVLSDISDLDTIEMLAMRGKKGRSWG